MADLHPRHAERTLESERAPWNEALANILSIRVAVARTLGISACDTLPFEVKISLRRAAGDLDIDVTVVTEGVSSWQLDSILRNGVGSRCIRSRRIGCCTQGHDCQAHDEHCDDYSSQCSIVLLFPVCRHRISLPGVFKWIPIVMRLIYKTELLNVLPTAGRKPHAADKKRAANRQLTYIFYHVINIM